VQSDWLRHMKWMQRRVQHLQAQGRTTLYWRGHDVSAQGLAQYCGLLMAQEKIWHEAMLSATLWFLWHELGIRDVYYHSWETGNALKNLKQDCAPPRSLYRDLPERFGFSQSRHGPGFLESERHVRKIRRREAAWNWYHWAA
jgi:hypothetical protein